MRRARTGSAKFPPTAAGWGTGASAISGNSGSRSPQGFARGELRPPSRVQAKDAARGTSERTRAVRDRVTRARTPGWALLGAVLLLALISHPPVSTAAEVTRPEYVARLEQICKPGSKATQRAVRGTRADVRSERLRRAATKVAKAKRIFSHTVSTISTVPRPGADKTTLARWFTALGRETVALQRTAAALRAEDVARFQRVWADFIHEGNKANNVVVSFGFNYCDFKPSRFQ
jgi:hypothetical protein